MSCYSDMITAGSKSCKGEREISPDDIHGRYLGDLYIQSPLRTPRCGEKRGQQGNHLSPHHETNIVYHTQ